MSYEQSYALIFWTGVGVACFKCRSVDGNNPNCRDPFNYQMKTEKRDCPAYERCAKITGTNGNRQYVIIRDCYKTNFQPKSGGYRDKRITYYSESIDGTVDVCKTNLCNSSPSRQVAKTSFSVLWTLVSIIAIIETLN